MLIGSKRALDFVSFTNLLTESSKRYKKMNTTLRNINKNLHKIRVFVQVFSRQKSAKNISNEFM